MRKDDALQHSISTEINIQTVVSPQIKKPSSHGGCIKFSGVAH